MGDVKIYEAPEVSLLGWSGLGEMHALLQWSGLDELPSATRLMEMAGKSCYWSFGSGRTGQEYIDHILEMGHGSVLEHHYYTLGLKGISRSCSHELVRHRHLSYSQLSQRYSTMVEFVRPPNWEQHGPVSFEQKCATAKSRYEQPMDIPLPEHKTKRWREVNRAFLPNCTATRMVVSGNARAWWDFLLTRGTKHADAEMQRLAVAIWKVLLETDRPIFSRIEQKEDGSLWSKYGKV